MIWKITRIPVPRSLQCFIQEIPKGGKSRLKDIVPRCVARSKGAGMPIAYSAAMTSRKCHNSLCTVIISPPPPPPRMKSWHTRTHTHKHKTTALCTHYYLSIAQESILENTYTACNWFTFSSVHTCAPACCMISDTALVSQYIQLPAQQIILRFHSGIDLIKEGYHIIIPHTSNGS